MKKKQVITTYLKIWEESLQQVTNDYEAGKEEENHFTAEEKNLVEQYRKIMPEEKKELQNFINYLVYKSERN